MIDQLGEHLVLEYVSQGRKQLWNLSRFVLQQGVYDQQRVAITKVIIKSEPTWPLI